MLGLSAFRGRQGEFAARGKERDGSAEFGSNLSRRLQSDGTPLLGPEHRQVGQALDAEPARKPTLHRGFRQIGGVLNDFVHDRGELCRRIGAQGLRANVAEFPDAHR